MIYFVKSGRFVKIGYAADVASRIKSVLTNNPHEVKLLATFEGGRTMESRLHRLFADERYAREWFHYGSRLKRFLRNASARGVEFDDGTVLLRAA